MQRSPKLYGVQRPNVTDAQQSITSFANRQSDDGGAIGGASIGILLYNTIIAIDWSYGRRVYSARGM